MTTSTRRNRPKYSQDGYILDDATTPGWDCENRGIRAGDVLLDGGGSMVRVRAVEPERLRYDRIGVHTEYGLLHLEGEGSTHIAVDSSILLPLNRGKTAVVRAAAVVPRATLVSEVDGGTVDVVDGGPAAHKAGMHVLDTVFGLLWFKDDDEVRIWS